MIDAAGLRITVMATPGHTADSLSFLLDDAVLTADTVLGRGTTVIDTEDGGLGDYLESLHRLRGLGHRTVLPGHGPELDDLEAVTRDVPSGPPRGTARPGARRAAGARRGRHRPRRSSNTSTPTSTKSCGTYAEWSVQAQLNYSV